VPDAALVLAFAAAPVVEVEDAPEAEDAPAATVNDTVPDPAAGHEVWDGVNFAGCFALAAARTGTGVTPETALPSDGDGAEIETTVGIGTCGASGTTRAKAATTDTDLAERTRPHRPRPCHAATRISEPHPSLSTQIQPWA